MTVKVHSISCHPKHACDACHKHWDSICICTWRENRRCPNPTQLQRHADQRDAQGIHPIHSTQSIRRRVEDYIPSDEDGPPQVKYRSDIGIMEKKMETTGDIGVI